MVRLTRIQHEGIPVRDVERSRRFYEEVIGLRPIPRPPLGGGVWLADPSGVPQIHIIECPEAVGPLPDKPNPRARHTAFLVEDYEGLKRRFQEHGVVWSEIPDSPVGTAQLFCLDPDGHTLEFQSAAFWGDRTWLRGYEPTDRG
jgi:catechol 2,3-dioxygenase-like lactoylglutathione lyase family enzyme